MAFHQIASLYLQKCGIKVSKAFMRIHMCSHPEYPSLLSFTDTLEELNVKYKAVISEDKQYKKLAYPLLLHTVSDSKVGFEIIASKEEFDFRKNELIRIWDGIVITVPANQVITDKSCIDLYSKERNDKVLKMILLLSAVFYQIYTLANNFTFLNGIFLISSSLGIVLSSQVVIHGLGIKTRMAQQLCGKESGSGCDRVLKSGAAILWKGFSLGEASLLYFIGLNLYILFAIFSKKTDFFYSLLVVPFSVGIIIAVISIYYQWRIIKAWCKMCLFINSILWAHFVSFLLTKGTSSHFHYNFFLLGLLAVASSFFLALTYLLLIRLIKNAKSAESFQIQLLKIKRDTNVFVSKLYKQRKIELVRWKNELILGNPLSLIQLTIAINPYCRPCAEMHQVVDELLTSYPGKVCSVLKFAINSESDKTNTAFQYIWRTLRINSNTKLNSAAILTEWFSLMNLSKFKKKLGICTMQKSDYDTTTMQKHINWSKDVNIVHTPTIFINGYELPVGYEIKDIKMLVNSLIENIALLPVVANTGG